jgi:tetratricopeptide (TPR) repeat protein
VTGATGLRLAAARWPFWERRGHLSEGRRWLAEALDLATAVAPAVRVNGLVGAARLAMDQAAYGEAAEHCAQAVALAREQENPPGLVAALNTRGVLAREQDRVRQLRARPSRGAVTGRGRAPTAAARLRRFSGCSMRRCSPGDASRAGALAEQGLTAARDSGDRHILAQVLFQLAWAASNTGAYERAEALGTEALGLFTALGGASEQAEALFLLGHVAVYSGDYERAERLFTDSLARCASAATSTARPGSWAGLEPPC